MESLLSLCACIGTINRVRASWRASVLDCGDGVFGVAALNGAAVSAVSFGILQSSKSQAPNLKEAPSTKPPNDRPLMLDKGSAVAGTPSCRGRLWDLKLGACLELGVWSLELYQPTHSKSVARAKAVTSRTPSPQSKTWRQIRRFMVVWPFCAGSVVSWTKALAVVQLSSEFLPLVAE